MMKKTDNTFAVVKGIILIVVLVVCAIIYDVPINFISKCCIVAAILGITGILSEFLSDDQPADGGGSGARPVAASATLLSSSSEEDDEEEDDDDGHRINFGIAGVKYYNSYQDCGGFFAWIVPEPDNPYDADALAIIRTDNKKIGHVYRSDQACIRNYMHGKSILVVGYITVGEDTIINIGGKNVTDAKESYLYGRYHILDGDPTKDEYARADLERYMQWMVDKFGKDYLPSDIKIVSENMLHN